MAPANGLARLTVWMHHSVQSKQRVKTCSGSGAVLACVQQAGGEISGEISDGEMT